MTKEEIIDEFVNCIEGSHTLNLAISILEEREELQQIIEKTSQKLELLLNDLKINSESEKESGKSYFNTNLFAIRVKEISKTLKDEKDENKKSQNSH